LYRGKILGTNISLDTSEDVVEWITARKARWPTAQRVKEKVRIAVHLLLSLKI